MSDSESEAQSTTGTPSDAALEKGLRNVVSKIFKSGKMEELTVKRVRLAAEQALALDEGFFKSHDTWKTKSDEIIKDEANKQEEPGEQASDPWPSPAQKEKRTQPQKTKSTKRTSVDTQQGAAKRRKKDSTPESVGEGSVSMRDSDGAKDDQTARSGASTARPSKNEAFATDESPGSDRETEAAVPKPTEEDNQDGADSGSELSVLEDEEPPPKKQRQKKTPSTQDKKPKPKPKPKSSKRKEESDIEPDQAEIKRLQGWLIKCGIRKMWSRELAPYDSPKAKIKHLRQMLKDAGMDGRYSQEKANRIKEERELQADLEGLQESAKRWGTAGTDDKKEEEAPQRRRLARGFKNFDFLVGDDEEGEESD